jgi:hypothetical protein
LGHLESCAGSDGGVAGKSGELIQVHPSRLYRNRQIAAELGLNASDVQVMTEQLRHGLVARTPEVTLAGEVEIDELDVVAGHKGQPAAVAKRGGSAAAAGWQERRAAARWRRTSPRSSA